MRDYGVTDGMQVSVAGSAGLISDRERQGRSVVTLEVRGQQREAG